MNILLLRGLTREQRHWESLPELLKQAIPQANVVCLDLPGAGVFNQESFLLPLEKNVPFLRQRWNDMKPQGPTVLLSMSLGSMLGLAWAHQFPQDFAGLININTSSRESPFYRRFRPQNYAYLLSVVAAKSAQEKELLVLKMSTSEKIEKLERSKKWGQWVSERPIAMETAVRQITAASGFKAPEEIRIPQVYFISSDDRLCHPSCSLALAQKYRAPYEMYETSSHDLPLEAPQWVADKSKEWIKTWGLLSRS